MILNGQQLEPALFVLLEDTIILARRRGLTKSQKLLKRELVKSYATSDNLEALVQHRRRPWKLLGKWAVDEIVINSVQHSAVCLHFILAPLTHTPVHTHTGGFQFSYLVHWCDERTDDSQPERSHFGSRRNFPVENSHSKHQFPSLHSSQSRSFLSLFLCFFVLM
jgi:hypothetical protein